VCPRGWGLAATNPLWRCIRRGSWGSWMLADIKLAILVYHFWHKHTQTHIYHGVYCMHVYTILNMFGVYSVYRTVYQKYPKQNFLSDMPLKYWGSKREKHQWFRFSKYFAAKIGCRTRHIWCHWIHTWYPLGQAWVSKLQCSNMNQLPRA
jgi:hypothetical protein